MADHNEIVSELEPEVEEEVETVTMTDLHRMKKKDVLTWILDNTTADKEDVRNLSKKKLLDFIRDNELV